MAETAKRAKDIFLAALDLAAPAERAAYLAQECANDEALRQHIEALLQAEAASGSFLEKPAAALEATTAAPDPVGARHSEGPGTRIGPYKLLELIGEGGMGVVYMAEQLEPVRRLVALKIIKPGMNSAEVLARFEAERQALALMDHPNIAKVLDAGTTAKAKNEDRRVSNEEAGSSSEDREGRPYFVMELVKGTPITKFCDERRLNPRQRLELFVAVCQAIQHAHQKGVIHRDIKPSNVLIALYDDKPVPKVIDFGIAKAAGQALTLKTLHTGFGAIVGTPEYMSPEQATFNQLDIDTRSDVYALGVLLYELLTGTTPVDKVRLKEAALLEVLRVVREEEPARPSLQLSTTAARASIAATRGTEPDKLSKLLRGELDWIVMKALEKERNRRYETAAGLARDVERYLRDELVEARPPSLGYRLRKNLRRHRGAAVTAGIVVLSLLLVLIATIHATYRAVAAAEAERQAMMAALANAEAAQRAEASERAARETEAAQRKRAVASEQEAQAARDEARRDAAIAQAVTTFLQHDLLGQSVWQHQPGEQQPFDPDVKVRTLLDRASLSLDGRFPKQPLTEAAIRLTIGDAYQALGQFARARPHLERSVALHAAALGDEAASTLISKTSLARMHLNQGNYDQGVALLQEIVRARSQKLPSDQAALRAVKSILGMAYLFQARYDDAEKLLDEVLTAARSQRDEDFHALGQCLLGLGSVYMQTGRGERAEVLFQELYQSCRARYGADHFDTLYARMMLGTLYDTRGQYAQAEPLLDEVHKAFLAKLENDHPALLQVQHNLALLYYHQSKFDKAQPLFAAATLGMHRKLTPSHPHFKMALAHWIANAERLMAAAETDPTFQKLSEFWRQQAVAKRLEGAEPLVRALGDYWKQTAGPDSPEYVEQLVQLAQIALVKNQFAEAEKTLRTVLAQAARFKGDGLSPLIKSLLGEALLRQKKYDEAEPLLKESHEAIRQLAKDDFPPDFRYRFTDALERLPRLYDATARADEARRLRSK